MRTIGKRCNRQRSGAAQMAGTIVAAVILFAASACSHSRQPARSAKRPPATTPATTPATSIPPDRPDPTVTVAPTVPDQAADLFVAPGAQGNCTQASPCGSIGKALSRAHSGDVVELAVGRYPTQDIGDAPPGVGEFHDNVVVRPAEGGVVVIEGVNVRIPRVTLSHLVIQGGIETGKDQPADYLRLENLDVRGGTVSITGANHSALVNSEVHAGLNVDGIDVKGGSDDVTIAGNEVHDMRHDSTDPIHVDCLQLFSASNVTIAGNRFHDCSRSALIVQTSGAQTEHIHVFNNVFAHCTPEALPGCENEATALWALGDAGLAYDYVIVNNLIDGSAFLDPVSGLVFRNNIVRSFFNTDTDKLVCGTRAESQNLVQLKGRCDVLGVGDRIGWPAVSEVNGRVAISPTAAVALDFADPSVAPETDMFGRRRCRPTVGPVAAAVCG